MSNETDRSALLEFRRQISDDPNQIFSSWNNTVIFCRWPGITCGRRHLRVTKLELPGSRFGGSLSPFIGNLSFLRVMNIENNSFTGDIPPGIGNLRKFPDFFGNFSSLEFIDGTSNNFWGTIPASLGGLRKLTKLYLGENYFYGTIPTTIFNLTSIWYIEFTVNQLEGGLPPDVGITILKLRGLSFGSNNLTGPIPPSVANATNLLLLQISKNNFSGSVPDLIRLNRLQWLSIAVNKLGSGTTGDLKFIESLNSTELRFLDIGAKNFGGSLPRSIGNLSSKLYVLSFADNRLTGTIPSSTGNLRNLETVEMGTNPMTGSLPGEIGNLHKLKSLEASNCGLSEEIPSSLANLTLLLSLFLEGNDLRGSIPASLSRCQHLMELDLSQNYLSGTIPWQVLSISSLVIDLDLSQNKLTGALPEEVGDLKNLATLSLQGNKLSGRVPNTLGECTSLVELYMGNNLFEGHISTFLSPMKGLQYLDLSLNNFSGEIPKFLGNFQLTYLNLSFNHFEGQVMNQGVFLNATGISIMGNDKLCGGISALNLPSCPPKSKRKRKILFEVIVATASGIAVLFIVLLLLVAKINMKRNRRKRNAKSQSKLVLLGHFPQISYEAILKATEGLHQNNFIGAGSFGSVYKGILENSDKMVAIKILDLKNRATSKSFMTECDTLRNIRHRNLVKIVTACSTIDFQGNDFKALVYEYLRNGSLEEWLHPKVASDERSKKLSLIHRLSIAIDIAYAVRYLHHESETPIIHCDLKPSNVFLDTEMMAHVGDFGLARLLCPIEVVQQASSVGLRGTVGYSPPEYGMGCEVSREGNIYSYGILLLKMFTGKRPTDGMFEDAWNIRSYCEAALPEIAEKIADPSLFTNEYGEGPSVHTLRRVKECLEKVFEVGIGCCRESPGGRMDIREAVEKLCSIKALLC